MVHPLGVRTDVGRVDQADFLAAALGAFQLLLTDRTDAWLASAPSDARL
jgi:hypothetical protein